MRNLTIRAISLSLIALLIAAAALFHGAPARAQDKKIVCDSDLVLNLYVAENYFNFAAVTDSMMMDAKGKDMKLVDSAKLDKGQYEPLFAAMMKSMGKDMKSQSGMMMDGKMMDSVMKGMMDDKMMGGMDSAMTTLKPATIAGEPAECTALRAELNKFYTVLTSQNMMAASPMMEPTKAK